jgi:hypothetical protein
MHHNAVVAAIGVALAAAGTLRGPRAAGIDLPAAQRPRVATLLEENAHTLLPLLTNPTGDPGEGHVEHVLAFSGKSAVRIVPMQRFEPQIPGWNYRIVEKPGRDEYRFVRWAWRADGCAGTMVQFHMETGWSIRYCAGQNDPGWGTKFVADKPPAGWVVVTRDLFADFGKCTITGIAMTAFRGRAAYFDHIYFGRSIEDLDRVDATGLRERGAAEVRLTPDVQERLWEQLSSADASKSYLAFWTLAADPKRSAPFLKDKLARPAAGRDAERLRQWIIELDDNDFKVRERASERLADHIAAAEALLKQELERDPPPEARARIERLLKGRDAAAARPDPIAAALRVLEYAEDPEARECLEAVAVGPDTPLSTALLAKAALQRLAERSRP